MKEIEGYELQTGLSAMQFDRVHAWLTNTYWSPGVSYERVVKAAGNSAMLVGAFQNGIQVSYLRVVSDKTTFAWLCDVVVDEAHRGKGLGRAMVRLALADPEYSELRRWVLATKDAHGVYAECGFETIMSPEKWMIRGENVPRS